MVIYEQVLYKCYVRANTNHYIFVLTTLIWVGFMNNEKTQKNKTNNQIKIFGTQTGVNIIESPVKAQILSILEEKKEMGQKL